MDLCRVLFLDRADLGTPQLSMHSIREMCGVDDVHHAIHLFRTFFKEFAQVDSLLQVD
jgi:aspartyl aminopeptidase